MTIKFLRECEAPKQFWQQCGDGCCSWKEWESATFIKDEEIDPEDSWSEVDISGLKFNEDYIIIQYP